MAIFLKNTTFHGILLDALFDAGSDNEEKAAVVRCVTEGIANGAVRPLPATVFSDQQLEQAFRWVPPSGIGPSAAAILGSSTHLGPQVHGDGKAHR